MKRFTQMAKSVTVSRRDLEFKVQERTIALERLTKIDPLTELLNRRGMAERVTSMDGRLEAHPLALGGFVVRAVLPVQPRQGVHR